MRADAAVRRRRLPLGVWPAAGLLAVAGGAALAAAVTIVAGQALLATGGQRP